MEQIVTLTCMADHNDTRLDQYLFNHFKEHSRSYFQKLINEGHIKINNRTITKSSYRLKLGDTITFSFPKPAEYEAQPINMHLDIIDIQPDFLVINKAAGVLVHPASTHDPEPTLISGLLYHFPELEGFSESMRPGIVHRIDKETSGLLLVARTIEGQIALAEKFQKREITKEYLAVVQGHPDKELHINHPIGRHPTQRHKMAIFGLNAKRAKSTIHVIKYFEDATLVRVIIETGRTHQIRVHCAAERHSIIGDITYGTKSKLIKRQALHAHKLAFFHKNKLFEYSAPLPCDIEKLITYYKKIEKTV